MEAKRLKVEGGKAADANTDGLAAVLNRLSALLTSGAAGSAADGLDELLDELVLLQTNLNASGQADRAFQSIDKACDKLQAAILSLQAAVDKFTPPLGYKPPAAGDEAYVRGLLSYAHRLSYTSSAPLGYQPGQPLYFFKPPAPQEAEMRVSQLHAFNREWEARQKELEAQRQAAARGAAAASAAQQKPAVPAEQAGAGGAASAGAGAGAQAGGDLAGLAAQHGLDIQQLLASMPPGWKPGDPIPLGPAAGTEAAAPAAVAPVPAAAQQQQASADTAAAAAAAPAAAPPVEKAAAAAPPAAPAPRLAGIFLNELDFGQYEYVSSAEEDSDEDDDDSDSD